MNKAFVKEPELGDGRCPRCNAPGLPVGPETLREFVPAELLSQITESAYFCPFERCDVAYFDLFERTIEQARLIRPVYPKDPAAPICGCFGLTESDIREDIDEGSVTRVRSIIDRSKTPAAQCVKLSPTGRCCVPEVQRCYMRLRGEK
jgi:bacterioferritin-associated ferredoxin